MRSFLRDERNFFQVVRESRVDKFGIIRRQSVQEPLHFLILNTENFRRTHAGTLRVAHQPRQSKLILAVGRLSKFI